MRTTRLLAQLSALIVLSLVLCVAGTAPVGARPAAQYDDPVKQGEYLANITGCIGCHTPIDANFQPDRSRLYAGGVEFQLGPLGSVFSKNLTPDVETGLGGWSDEEIKRAIRTGVSRDGLHLFPIMPYLYFNKMADSDVDAIVAYLRTLQPVRNVVPRQQILPPEQLPQLPFTEGIVAPVPSDTAARAEYLMTAVTACSDCHTPVNPETGQPILEKYLAGGQPFEGPWGIVYAGNLTPDQETGIGNWSDNDIKRVLRLGVRPNGRRVVLMPWQDYAPLTEEDLNAIVHYLRNNLATVSNEVPAPAIEPEFIQFAPAPAPVVNTGLIVAAVAAVVIIGGAIAVSAVRRRGSPKAS